MAIPILAVAFGIYIFGVSLVLYLKPTFMFGNGGDWKEFGIGRGDGRTVVPFWLFSIFWAFISYGVALVIMSQFANLAHSAFPELNQGQQQPYLQLPSMSMQAPSPVVVQAPAQELRPPPNNIIKPVSSSLGVPGNMPGFYVLQNPGSSGSAPQYVYYGAEPPKM